MECIYEHGGLMFYRHELLEQAIAGTDLIPLTWQPSPNEWCKSGCGVELDMRRRNKSYRPGLPGWVKRELRAIDRKAGRYCPGYWSFNPRNYFEEVRLFDHVGAMTINGHRVLITQPYVPTPDAYPTDRCQEIEQDVMAEALQFKKIVDAELEVVRPGYYHPHTIAFMYREKGGWAK